MYVVHVITAITDVSVLLHLSCGLETMPLNDGGVVAEVGNLHSFPALAEPAKLMVELRKLSPDLRPGRGDDDDGSLDQFRSRPAGSAAIVRRCMSSPRWVDAINFLFLTLSSSTNSGANVGGDL